LTLLRDEAFTQIPNRLIRSTKIDVYAKAVYGCLASCNPSFPSYEKISEWTGIKKRDVISRSLRKLEEHHMVRRYKVGRKIVYHLTLDLRSEPPKMGKLVSFRRSPTVTDQASQPVTHGDRTSHPGELIPVTHGDPIKNKEKEQKKESAFSISKDEIQEQPQKARNLRESIDRAFARSKP
jgi:hypothetical protein